MTKNLGINGKEPQPWKIGTYEKTQVGAFITPSKTCSIKNPFTSLPYANEALGVKAEKGNFFASAEIGVGTSATAKVETGYEIPIGKHFGLELSADARAAQSMIGQKVDISNNMSVPTSLEHNTEIEDYHVGEAMQYELLANNHLETRYKTNNLAAGVNLMAKQHFNHMTLGAGVRAAVVSGSAPNVYIEQNIEQITVTSQTFVSDINLSESTSYIGVGSVNNNAKVGEKHTQFVVSPVAEIKATPGKWEIGGRLSFDEAKVSAAYKF